MAAGNAPPLSHPHPTPPNHISQENRNVVDLREKIKAFLASQGMIKGHSGTASRAAEQDPQILALSADYVSPTNSPQTPTLSISSTNDERPSSYPLRTDRYPDNDRKTTSCTHLLLLNPPFPGLPVMHELSPDSPLEREYPEVLLPPVSFSSPPVHNSLDSCKTSYRY